MVPYVHALRRKKNVFLVIINNAGILYSRFWLIPLDYVFPAQMQINPLIKPPLISYQSIAISGSHFNIKSMMAPLNNNHLSTKATVFGSLGIIKQSFGCLLDYRIIWKKKGKVTLVQTKSFTGRLAILISTRNTNQ